MKTNSCQKMTISQTCLLTIILFLSFSLTAQNKSQTNNSINIVLGKQITNTYKITDIFNVVEGFAPDAQESRNGNKISFSYHRRFNKIGYLGLRFGYDEIIVNSIGLKGGIGPPRLYNLDFKFPFLSFGLSHFKIMKLNRNNFLKLSNSISI